MQLIRGAYNLLPKHHGCVASIGNYDGIHLGHQAVIEQLINVGRGLHTPVTIVTFEPHPQEYFAGQNAPVRLTSLRDKLETLAQLGVDRVVCLRFKRELAETSARVFVERYLVNGIGVRHLVVGDDFRFGKQRQGDFALLKRLGAEQGFEVVHTDTHYVDGERVSSSRIRASLADSDFETARRLLGRPFQIAGRVIHGDKRGRSWGFPTANVAIRYHRAPVSGIFVVHVLGITDVHLRGVASLGVRPTVDGSRVLLEVYLFDFERDLYGQRIQVVFLHKLRDEKRFDSVEALRHQMRHDVEAARMYFGERETTWQR